MDNLESSQEEMNQNEEKITLRGILLYFVLFRFIGSIVLFLVIVGFIELLGWESGLVVTLGVVAGFNIIIQFISIIVAFNTYYKQRRHKGLNQ